MASGKEIETRGHIVGFQEEVEQAARQGKDDFFTWFDSAADADASFVRGSWDFVIHIASPLAKYLDHPERKVVLEIGHGGGRILAAASRSFKGALGVDVHDNNDLVYEELKNRGIANVKLFKTDGRMIPLEDNAVDAAYSFIVLQHVEKIEIFKMYFAEVYRVLKPGGVAVLYFGRKSFWSINKNSAFLYWLDCLWERWVFRKSGYMEIPARVNTTNLVVTAGFAKQIAIGLGFQILKQVVSHKRVPDGVTLFGGQHGLVLKK